MEFVETPPGFVVRTEAQKAAWDNGYRLERGIEGGWLRYASTTAPGDIWIAGTAPHGPWLLSIAHRGVAAELEGACGEISGPGFATYRFAVLNGLHAALDRIYKLAVRAGPVCLNNFSASISGASAGIKNHQLSWWFDGEPLKAVSKDSATFGMGLWDH